MPRPDFAAIAVGDTLPPLVLGPVTRHTLGLYAGASGDYNPLHIDQDYARREAGMADVFAHGMLSAAWLARVLTRWADPTALRQLSVRFVAITHVGDEVHCRATVAGKYLDGDTPCVRLDLQVHNQAGAPRLTGTAVLALPRAG
ncbi:MAG: dehydratase [Burkholderiales bacterium]|nr:dehydratase [Burkholderiales bacterium]